MDWAHKSHAPTVISIIVFLLLLLTASGSINSHQNENMKTNVWRKNKHRGAMCFYLTSWNEERGLQETLHVVLVHLKNWRVFNRLRVFGGARGQVAELNLQVSLSLHWLMAPDIKWQPGLTMAEWRRTVVTDEDAVSLLRSARPWTVQKQRASEPHLWSGRGSHEWLKH